MMRNVISKFLIQLTKYSMMIWHATVGLC